MASKTKLILYTMEDIKNEFIGKRGSPNREKYEQKLQKESEGNKIRINKTKN